MQIKNILALSFLAAPALSAHTRESGENGFVGIKRNNKWRIDAREYEESTDVLKILGARSVSSDETVQYPGFFLYLLSFTHPSAMADVELCL